MSGPHVVVTGVGVLAPNSIGTEAFWDGGLAGRTEFRPITLFDPLPYRCHLAGELSDFQPEALLGSQGLRTLDRTTRLALGAAQLALEDAGLDPADGGPSTGVVLGSTGSVRSISEFDLEGLREGPRYVNPALFPNAVMNSPASQVAIRFTLRGPNSTINTGFTAGLDAVGYALGLLRLGRAERLVVGGVEELCLQTFLGFYRAGLLATHRDGTPPPPQPFHPRSPGALLGEGAALVVLETAEAAARRGARAYAEVSAYRTAFGPPSLRCANATAGTAAAVLRQTLLDARLSVDAVDYIAAGASGARGVDAPEREAFQQVFGRHASRLRVGTVKSRIGESFSAGGAFQLADALGAMARQALPATVRWLADADDDDPELVAEPAGEASVSTAIVHAVGPTGIASALALRCLGGRRHTRRATHV